MSDSEKQKPTVRTVKLKLVVLGDQNDDKKAAWKRLREINNATWKAANMIASGQYFNDTLMRKVYGRLKIDPKDLKQVNEAEKRFEEFFGVKRQATTERDIKAAFPELPSTVTNRLNNDVVSSYKQEKQDLLRGQRSLRTYRDATPIPVGKVAVTFEKDAEDRYNVVLKTSRTERFRFGIYFGRDKANNRLTVERILNATYDFSAPSFQLKDNEWFLLLPVKEPVRPVDLNPEVSVGVDLGLSIPAYCASSDGPQRQAIGSREDFLKTRMQLQSRRRRLQRSLVSVHGGNGRKRKMKALDDLGKKEQNFARSYNHMISRRVVDFAVKVRAGTIKLELLEGFSREDRSSFILRNWSYFDLQTDIKYKAKQYGIKVVFIDPYHTSQTCSQCGHYEEGQREKQAEFRCKSCEEGSLNADYNAALNIAKSDAVVTKKEQCQYYKEQMKSAGKPAAAGPTAEG